MVVECLPGVMAGFNCHLDMGGNYLGKDPQLGWGVAVSVGGLS